MRQCSSRYFSLGKENDEDDEMSMEILRQGGIACARQLLLNMRGGREKRGIILEFRSSTLINTNEERGRRG